MKLALFGANGKVGRVLGPALEAAGHEVRGVGRDEPRRLDGLDAAVEFSTPGAAPENIRASLGAGLPCVAGTSGFELAPLGELARERGIALFHAANFAIGAVLMMRFAAEAAAYLPRAEIVELHDEAKLDAPSGTAKATAARLPEGAEIHSVRLPGLVAHQEVLLGGDGQLLTIRHDAFSREAYVPGVLLALERLGSLPPGLTEGLETLLTPNSG
ncbi:MAG TPA: dihydrodipicolinate reductase C-terminal domain-containing protein [Gaiellaceae bacterium]|jgi:4-hydroxy-tetrahydrodipicolinate reductase